MFDILIVGLIVTAFVLGLFRIVQWMMSFFPAFKGPHLDSRITDWCIVLFLLSMWLKDAAKLLDYGNLKDWEAAQYWDLLLLCGITYCIVVVWNHKFKNSAKP